LILAGREINRRNRVGNLRMKSRNLDSQTNNEEIFILKKEEGIN